MSSKLYFSVICILIAVCYAHNTKNSEHYKDGVHDSSFDHQAIVGSKKTEQEFSTLKPEEAKKRLGQIVDKMDVNKDQIIDKKELHAWVVNSFKALNEEEALEDLKKSDKNKDGLLTWVEYLEGEHSYTEEEAREVLEANEDDKDLKEYKEMLISEKKRFENADLNKDGKLDNKEFTAFENPHNYEHMYDYELGYRLNKADTNKDKQIDFEEFLKAETNNDDDKPDKEKVLTEKTRFEEYDVNKDGSLDRDEMKKWIMMNHDDMAEDEVDHLFSQSDANEDGKLTRSEILEEHSLWVGSEVGEYGHRVIDEL